MDEKGSKRSQKIFPQSALGAKRVSKGTNVESVTSGASRMGTTQNASLSPIPSYVGHYKTIKTLGVGCFGRVLLAEHVLSGERVAVKFIQGMSQLDAKVRRTVNREICLLKLLSHPHIVRSFEVIEEGEQHGDFIAVIMENIEGGELFDYINGHGPLPEEKACRWFTQLLSAVDYCQGNFLVHRDVKPENILIDSKHENVKLIDFGFANFFSSSSYLSTFCGSPFYAAPEVIQGTPYIGPEIDVWSLGVTLYAMLCGKLPFEADSMSILLEKQRKGAYSREFLSPMADRLLRKMFQFCPHNRATLEEIKADPWVQQYKAQVSFDHNLNRTYPIPFPRTDAVNFLKTLGYGTEQIVRVLSKEKCHPLSALYYLYLESEERQRSQPRRLSTAELEKNHVVEVANFNSRPECLQSGAGVRRKKSKFSFLWNCFSPQLEDEIFAIHWGFRTFSATCSSLTLEQVLEKVEALLVKCPLLSVDRTINNEFVCSTGGEQFVVRIKHSFSSVVKVNFRRKKGSALWLRKFSKHLLCSLNEPLMFDFTKKVGLAPSVKRQMA